MRKLNINTIFCLLCIGFSQVAIASKKLTENYILQYKNIAIAEMRRTGIPASIKLAQGILESDLGRSPLANKANNHFGIKCGNNWSGETYSKHDDETDSTGEMIESCFRAYKSGEESYLAHSDFLANPSKQSRYGFLFELPTTDYTGWANGLKFAGYATDPSYPNKLIKIIESYELFKYDEKVQSTQSTLVFNDNKAENKYPKENTKYKSNTPDNSKVISWSNMDASTETKITIGKYHVKKINDLKMVKAYGGESVKELALRNKKSVFDILEYNEGIISQDHILERDEIVFLQKKKKSVEDESLAFHTVNKGETIYMLAQKYGVRLESILSKNNLPENGQPLAGELISLNRNLSKKEAPKYRIDNQPIEFVDFGGLK